MLTDREQTKMLREARLNERKAIKESNQIGKRLIWVREKLEMGQMQICEATGIPPSSLCGREAGIRAELVEEYLVLSIFFDRLWQSKYTEGFPLHQGEEVRKISVQWLLFGHHDLDANAEDIIEQYQLRAAQIEEEFFRREQEKRKQLDFFKENK